MLNFRINKLKTIQKRNNDTIYIVCGYKNEAVWFYSEVHRILPDLFYFYIVFKNGNNMPYFDDQLFEKLDYTSLPLAAGNYENCRFSHCNFAESDLARINFTDCEFDECNLSMVNLVEAQLYGVSFRHCKMLGVKFEYCNPNLFSVTFSDCMLDHSTFFRMKMKKTLFRNCRLHEVDFTETILHEAFFDDCDLLGATFSYTQLQKANLSTAFNFSIDPDANQLKKTIFSRDNLTGLLGKYDLVIK